MVCLAVKSLWTASEYKHFAPCCSVMMRMTIVRMKLMARMTMMRMAMMRMIMVILRMMSTNTSDPALT